MEQLRLKSNGKNNVLYMGEDGKWKSTGKKTKEEAIQWFYEQKEKDEVTLKLFADNMFTDNSVGSYRYLQEQTGRHSHESWWYEQDKLLHRYLIPQFGKTPIYKMTTRQIQAWYLSFKGVSKKELSAEAKKKIINCLSTVMQHAVYMGLIDKNPCKEVIRIKCNNKGRKVFSEEELEKMFPANDIDLINIWGNLMWATYFMIMADTGWRPGEIAALTKEGFFESYNGIYTTKSVNSFDKKIQDTIKTTEGGYTYRIGIVSDRTAKLIKRLIIQRGEGLLFTTFDNRILCSTLIRQKFREKMERIGIDVTGRPPYALRTTFMTRVANKYQREQVEELMGHKQWRACYDKRTPEDVIKKVSEYHKVCSQ